MSEINPGVWDGLTPDQASEPLCHSLSYLILARSVNITPTSGKDSLGTLTSTVRRELRVTTTCVVGLI